jgi:hypothetical protein
LSLAKGGLALFAFDLIRWTSISDPRWNAKLFDYFMIAEFAMKFLTSERSITTVKPRPKRITLAEFARLKLLGATEMAAQPSTLTLQREENVATRVAAAMQRFRQCRPAHSSKCASGANFSAASRGRNPKIVDLFAGF